MNNAAFETRPLTEFLDDFENLFARPQYREERPLPPVNIEETDSDYRLEVLAPGFSREEISLDVENDLLIVSGKKPEPAEGDPRRYRVREFAVAGFERRFRLGERIDREKISARMENGVLTVVCARTEKELPRKISIEVAS